MSQFESLGLERWLAKQCEAMALTKPTAVQQTCIPAVINDFHVVGGAATGSGKTAAFALPIIQRLSAEMYGVFALVLTPSRELAYQIIDQFVAFGAPAAIRTAIVIGGVNHGSQRDALLARPHIVVATPGRLRMLLANFPEVQLAFKNVRYLVLDEADRLIEGDIQHDMYECIGLLGPAKPFRRTLLFSATIDSRLTRVEEGTLPRLGITDQATLKICSCYAAEASSGAAAGAEGSAVVEAAGADHQPLYTIAPNLTEQYIFIPSLVKLPYLVCLLRSVPVDTSFIIFCNSCYRSEIVRLALQLLGFPVCSLNSLLTQQKRLTNLALFKAGIAKVLVATDIAARGLDIPDVEMVLHYDFPKLSATYVHRVGRTARAGRSGRSVAVITDNDVSLVHKVERRTKTQMKKLVDDKVCDEEVVKILDEVSAAKVEAQMQVEQQFGERAAALKDVAQARRPEINRRIREDGKGPVSAEAKKQRRQHQQHKKSRLSLRSKTARSDDAAEESAASASPREDRTPAEASPATKRPRGEAQPKAPADETRAPAAAPAASKAAAGKKKVAKKSK